jgi:hypothetical protein
LLSAAIIAGSLVSVISFLYGVLVFYNANKLNQQRLHQLFSSSTAFFAAVV